MIMRIIDEWWIKFKQWWFAANPFGSMEPAFESLYDIDFDLDGISFDD